MTPAEHAAWALARVECAVEDLIGDDDYYVRDVISALRGLLNDPATRGDVLVALGLEVIPADEVSA